MDDDFKKIEGKWFEESSCTPVVTEANWHGILIDAPKDLHHQKSAAEDHGDDTPIVEPHPKLIIAGVFMFETKILQGRTWSRDGTPTLTITNNETGQSWGNTLEGLERSYVHVVLGMNVSYAPQPELPLDEGGASDGQICAEGGAFNADIGFQIPRPKTPVEYTVSVAYGPYRSNEVVIAVHP